MVEQVAGVQVAGVPFIDDQRRRSRSQVCNPVVQCRELLRDGFALVVEVLPFTAQPVGGSLDTAFLAVCAVEGSVGEHIGPSRRTDLWITVEGGQTSQSVFNAVVAAAGLAGSAVVDQLTVRVGAWVGGDQESIAVAQRVLDRRLECWILQGLEPSDADLTSFG